MKARNITRYPTGGRGITSLPGSLTTSLSRGIRPRSRSLRRSLSRVSDCRQPPSVTRVAAALFFPPAVLVPTADEDFFDFPIAVRRRRQRERRMEEGNVKGCSSAQQELSENKK